MQTMIDTTKINTIKRHDCWLGRARWFTAPARQGEEIMHLKIHVIGPDPVEPVVRTETTADSPDSTARFTPDSSVTTTRSFTEWQLERRRRAESALISVVALQGQDDESAENGGR
jgi:hypothetical protein